MKDSTFKKYCLIIDEWLVNGNNGTKAHQKFNPSSSDENSANRFLEIVRISEVEEYKNTKLNNTSNKLQITLESQLKELDELKVLSKKDNRFNDAINAVKEQNKLLALYEDHNKQKNKIITPPTIKFVDTDGD